MDDANRTHYVSRSYTEPSVLDTWRTKLSDPAWVAERAREIRTNLSVIDRYLKLQSESAPADDGGLWLVGRGVSHADAEIFALYCGMSYSREIVEQVWESKELPYLGKWLQAMKARYIQAEELWEPVN